MCIINGMFAALIKKLFKFCIECNSRLVLLLCVFPEENQYKISRRNVLKMTFSLIQETHNTQQQYRYCNRYIVHIKVKLYILYFHQPIATQYVDRMYKIIFKYYILF